MKTGLNLDSKKKFPFIWRHISLTDVLTDRELASLGDSYVNFVYSLALSKKMGKPIGRKISSSSLASALRKANLRKLLAPRTDRHKQADAVEALAVYAWLTGAVPFENFLHIIEREESVEDAFSLLLQIILSKINLEISTKQF
ncbi:MAG: ribonuclease III family protein [Candidatus Bathyarchaeia archaeon]